MNKNSVAGELVKLAKELLSSSNLVLISDLSRGKAYFVNNIGNVFDRSDRSVYQEVLRKDGVVSMGKVVGNPERLFSFKDNANYRRYGLGFPFSI